MDILIKEILINKESRQHRFLEAFIGATFNAGQPWG